MGATWRLPGDFRVWQTAIDQRIESIEGKADGKKMAQALLEHVKWADGRGDMSLAKPIGGKTRSWHSPAVVYALVMIYNKHPDLRADIPLKKILDFWVAQMAKTPDPVRPSGNATIITDQSPYARLFAIGALHASHVLLKDKTYADARDAQVKRMQQRLKERGLLDAIYKKTGWQRRSSLDTGPAAVAPARSDSQHWASSAR